MRMTIKQKIWLQVLRDTCGCYPGYGGNMPCDNGMICDRCSAKWVQEEYNRRLCKELAITGKQPINNEEDAKHE